MLFISRQQIKKIRKPTHIGDMPAFLARSTTSLFKRNVTFLLGIGRMTYVQKVFGDFGFGKGGVENDMISVQLYCNICFIYI